MTVVLGGGRSENYYLRILVIGKGMSAAANENKFSYQIVVDSISPTTGTISGGYQLTITGKNFAPAKGSTQVFIGDGLGSLCPITSISETQIKCRVPQMDSTYKSGDAQKILVTGRLIENSRCSSTCEFTYDTSSTVYAFLSAGPDFAAGDEV